MTRKKFLTTFKVKFSTSYYPEENVKAYITQLLALD